MSITAKMIHMLNQQYTTPIYAQIEDAYAEGSKKISGTRVVLRFPAQEFNT